MKFCVVRGINLVLDLAFGRKSEEFVFPIRFWIRTKDSTVQKRSKNERAVSLSKGVEEYLTEQGASDHRVASFEDVTRSSQVLCDVRQEASGYA